MDAKNLPDHVTAAGIEQPQPAKENELSPEARLADLKKSTSALSEIIRFSEDPAFYDELRDDFLPTMKPACLLRRALPRS